MFQDIFESASDGATVRGPFRLTRPQRMPQCDESASERLRLAGQVGLTRLAPCPHLNESASEKGQGWKYPG